MPTGVLVPPTAAPLAFDVLDCQAVGPEPVEGSAPRRWRLHGRAADGRRLLLDFYADAAPAPAPARAGAAGPAASRARTGATDAGAAVSPLLPPRLTRATVVPSEGWVIHAEQGHFDLGAVRLFVHEDVSAQAALAVPPRPVPLGKRLFWRAVFALLATRAGRRWLERRASA
jgi:hypothetical protein